MKQSAYDFYKPNMSSPFPTVDGQLSVVKYMEGLDYCFDLYRKNFEKTFGDKFDLEKSANFYLFHSPFTKLVRKSFARMFFREWRENRLHSDLFKDIDPSLLKLSDKDSYNHNDLFKIFTEITSSHYSKMVEPGLLINKNVGNTYTGSLYMSLLSLIAQSSDSELRDKRVVAFSYGSGFASTLFSLKFVGDVSDIRKVTDVKGRLERRTKVDAIKYTEILNEKEHIYAISSFNPKTLLEELEKGTFYLDKVDDLGRRFYKSL